MGSPKGLRIGFPSFQSGTSPQPDSRHRKRKSYFQYFSFDFFSMAVMKPGHNTILNPLSLLGPSEPCEPDQLLGQNSLATALGSGKWLPGPSCGSERVGAPGNLDPSATISVTRSVRSFRLGTELPGLSDRGGEALVEAPSEDELLEECPVAELGEPDCVEELELEEALIGRLVTRSRLRLRHSINLEGGHIVSYGDLPRVHNLHLRAKNAGGGGILAAGPRGSARLKNEDGVRNLFRLPTLILSGDFSHHPAIN
ncbi:hypothetical protein Cgig2_008910 [Carnegiea gigantea]|uniref:Uncharacterized protein n=1 Tax=Carnegiea gigantea TaxID=171969 RepID=A0A9Q1GU80_9CARY|nr:hypothetical protein Cgig2_008910 [Carnegiea gigantea]